MSVSKQFYFNNYIVYCNLGNILGGKKMKKLLALVLTMILTIGLVGCGGTDGKQVEADKTQLNISCWDGGFGISWLEAIGKRFEEKYADYSFEPNKKGVQVWTTASKGNVYDSFATKILSLTDDISISEQCNYNGFVVHKSALDITDAVTTPLTEYGETRSIADKLSADDRSFYGVESNKYYGLPWYESTFGFQYDIELFEEENLYFAADGQGDSDGFITRSNMERGTGPDGKSGTSDDGLPRTYDEFFKLLDKIYELEMTPVIWAGNAQVYINNLLLSLIADYEGYDQMSLNYNLNGKATDLIESISDGKVTFMSPIDITNANGYLLQKQAGRYYGLAFLEKLLTTKDANGEYKYFSAEKSRAETRTQKQAQSDFLRGRFSETVKTTAILIDGSWWYSEAKSTFSQMSNIPGASATERKIGFMPFPKVNESALGETTWFNNWMTSINIRSNLEPEKQKVAKQFIRFMHTDESLSEFTKITSGVRPFSYNLTEKDEPQTSYYGKQLLQIHNENTAENPTIVSPWSMNKLIVSNLSNFMINDQVFHSLTNGSSYTLVANALIDYKVSAKQYFDGLSSYWNEERWNEAYKTYLN